MDAEYIVTDSFHACAFSIIFGKPFIAIGNTGRGLSRFTSLLTTFGLQDRLVINETDFSNILRDIDETFHELTDLHRAESNYFLTTSI